MRDRGTGRVGGVFTYVRLGVPEDRRSMRESRYYAERDAKIRQNFPRK